jgi:hypothetical protein
VEVSACSFPVASGGSRATAKATRECTSLRLGTRAPASRRGSTSGPALTAGLGPRSGMREDAKVMTRGTSRSGLLRQ